MMKKYFFFDIDGTLTNIHTGQLVPSGVETLRKLEEKGANIALRPMKTQVGYMARVIDPNGINIVLVQHTK